MKERIKKLFLRVIYGVRYSPESFIKYLRSEGMQIGEGTIFFDPINTVVDAQNPKLVTIGSNVRITSGCKILTHDFSWSVIGGVYGECVGAVGTIKIGNNVFLGVNSVILRNTSIGDNVVIGAGSVVSGNLDSNSVYAGNPARKIMSLEELYDKRKRNGLDDIQKILAHIDCSDKNEVVKYLREYGCYFADFPEEMKQQIMLDTGYFSICKEYYDEHLPELTLKQFISY